jgi:hypothetical protein
MKKVIALGAAAAVTLALSADAFGPFSWEREIQP